MRQYHTCFLVFTFFTIVACTTTRQDTTDNRSDSTAPALKLCSGLKISNSPPTDNQRRLVHYKPVAHIANVTLLRAPVEGCVSSGFGPRRGGASSIHKGVDLYTGKPTPIRAGGDGVVVTATTQRGYGNIVIIQHNKRVSTRYAHMSGFASGIKPGKRVRRGDVIGRTGRTGNATATHLHYEIRVNGKAKNPLLVGE